MYAKNRWLLREINVLLPFKRYITCLLTLAITSFKNDRQIFNPTLTQFTRAVILERRAESEWWQKKKQHVPLSEESGIGYRKTHLISPTFARFFTLPRTFFITIFPTAFYDRSRMTGRYLIPFRIKSFFVSAHTYPFRQLRWHFSQGKASHSLLLRRSAPRKVVRLLPEKRGRLAFCTFPFYVKYTGTVCILYSVLCVLIWQLIHL